MRLRRDTWEKLLRRWSDMPESAERNLLLAVMAQAIADEQSDAENQKRTPDFRRGFFVNGLKSTARPPVLGTTT